MLSHIASTLSQPETSFLLRSFIGALVLLFVLEHLLPRTQRAYAGRGVRNGVLLGVNTLLKLLLPVSLVAASLFALFEQFGVLNMIKLGLWTKIVIAWLVLDLFTYWLHRSYHSFDVLWRFHCVHHTDTAVDVTTPFRTHPIEMLLTLCAKAVLIILFGMPLLGVILYEVIVAVMALWVQGFHRQHHGDTAESCRQNYGLVLTVWDRMFGTVSPGTSEADTATAIRYNLSGKESLAGLLVTPFHRPDDSD